MRALFRQADSGWLYDPVLPQPPVGEGLANAARNPRTPGIAAQAPTQAGHSPPDYLVFDVVTNSALPAYDAEFVARAAALSVPLVTGDKAVLKAFPSRALTMEPFLKSSQAPPLPARVPDSYTHPRWD